MKKDGSSPEVELRGRAETRLSEVVTRDLDAPTVDNARRLVHELQVHQLELEMQNEELARSRAEVEAALQRNTALYNDLYDFVPVGYVTLDRGGAIRKANLTAARMVGVVRSELVGRPLRRSVAATDRPAFDAALTKALAGKSEESCEVELAPAAVDTSEPQYVQLTLSASEHDDELRAVLVDVTARRRSDEQLRAWQKMEAVGRLTRGIAHDFNNLLTVILSNAALAEDDLAEAEKLRGDLREIRLAAERATGLTRRLLALGRKDATHPQLTDINQCVREAMKVLPPNDLVELNVVLAQEIGQVEVDPVQFEQVVMDLAVNALHAMPKGGKLTVATSIVEVDEARARRSPALRAGSYVHVSVSDTGVGMDKVAMTHIFEPFVTTKDKAKSNGLGLPIVHAIVTRWGGDISVSGEPGSGTTFEVHLPRAPARRPQAPVATTVTKEKTNGSARVTETILVLDDERALRAVTARILSSAGYAVLVAGSGAEALVVCEKHAGTIHMALSDVVMPGMNGLVFAEHLKRIRPDTKVLHMSGYAANAVATSGTIDELRFITKPFGAKALLEKIRELLDEGRELIQKDVG